MSGRRRVLLDSTRRALNHECPHCGAKPGTWCHAPSGKALDSVAHAARRALEPIDPAPKAVSR